MRRPIAAITTSGRNLIVLMAVGFAALVLVGGMSVWLVNRNSSYGAEVTQAFELKTALLSLLSLAQDAETGQRGYLLTSDERYLEPYRKALADRETTFNQVVALSEFDVSAAQRADIAALRDALTIRFDVIAETVALQSAGKAAEALALVETERGRNAMRAIRRIVTDGAGRLSRRLADRTSSLNEGGRLLIAVNLFSLALVGLLAVIANLIARRQTRALTKAGELLSQANVGLEAAVQERTSELVSANEEIQRFAYIVSHDLRAPLVNVMGFTAELDAARKVLKDQIEAFAVHAPERVSNDAKLAVDEDLPEAIGFIRTSTSKMDRLINAILSLSREGRRVITPETIKVDEMVETIAETLRQQTWAADAEIVAEPGLPAIVTDRLSFEQVLQNLIENAVKYLDRSRPGRIVVSGRRIGPMVEYAIADNGRGIDAKDHERVFELFRRAGAQDQPGEGLGLAFVRASVRRLGGAIRLTSELGKGSTFHVSFPAVIRPQTESRAA